MRKIMVTFALLTFSAIGFAATPNLSDLRYDHTGREKAGACMKAGWDAAQPTDAQNAALKTLLDTLHTLIANSKTQIETAIRELYLTWGHHPVDKNAVHGSQYQLDQLITPVRDAIIDTMADGIDLLTIEQRQAYDAAFGDCMRAKK
jgi:hypothetical protein